MLSSCNGQSGSWLCPNANDTEVAAIERNQLGSTGAVVASPGDRDAERFDLDHGAVRMIGGQVARLGRVNRVGHFIAPS